jgi:hypothetical protein
LFAGLLDGGEIMTASRPAGSVEVMAKSALDRSTAMFYSVFTTAGFDPDAETVQHLFLPSAVIVLGDRGEVPLMYSPSEFIRSRLQLLTSGRLIDFEENEVAERTEMFGGIAYRRSDYRSSGVLDDKVFLRGGSNRIQFLSTPDGWRISALVREEGGKYLSQD